MAKSIKILCFISSGLIELYVVVFEPNDLAKCSEPIWLPIQFYLHLFQLGYRNIILYALLIRCPLNVNKGHKLLKKEDTNMVISLMIKQYNKI